ncbi:L-lysine 6-monooxygenase (NADPH-requiring)-domain-containing protein [Xylariaceae sp. FL0662B]|nr:L-lysine 6-monooxygenase (NADPH-requiring)-domain-containing protein [Xylariaceae sp. FL0662B]
MAPNNLIDTHEAGRRTSHLRRTSAEDVHDLICVGFGPASLAIAVTLHDILDRGRHRSLNRGSPPKVLFLEKQPKFSWHSGMLLPGTKMQISFIKDMASLRDPTSKFTFLNYLHQHDRLVQFTNLSTFLPSRAEYEDYLRWCASSFDEVVQYGNEVISVSPVDTPRPNSSVSSFTVTSRDTKSGSLTTYRTKNVVVAVGGQPSIPKPLPSNHPRVVHSSQYEHIVPNILNRRDAPYRVAIVGAGQSAAEIFNNIQTLYPNSQTYLVMRPEFLKPSDDSPFVNSIFNPSYVDSLYPRPVELRRSLLEEAQSTNYGVVRLNLIERLYERMYEQRRVLGPDERKWPHRILAGTEVVGLDTNSNPLRLTIRSLNPTRASASEGETLEVDLVVAATGYQRQSHLDILEPVANLLPQRSEPAKNEPASNVPNTKFSYLFSEATVKDRAVRVARDYSVQFNPGKVAPGSGIWLQGVCESTHGLSDTLLSILPNRSEEVINSIFGEATPNFQKSLL